MNNMKLLIPIFVFRWKIKHKLRIVKRKEIDHLTNIVWYFFFQMMSSQIYFILIFIKNKRIIHINYKDYK